MDSRLYITLSSDENGNLVADDFTNYSEWSEDVSNHTSIERLLDSELKVLETKTGILQTHTVFDLFADGMYAYQKLILPTYGHEGNSNCYYKDGEIYLDGEVVSFDEVWKVKSDNVNIFWFDDVFFSIFNLIKCFILTENNRLDSIFKNGCRITCTDNPYGANADFLASAIFVLRYLIKQGKYFEAQEILNKLHTCNGICKDVKDSLRECGCGEG